jgi:hypothetical protein
MRLIHIETLDIYEFIGDKIPPYAILSHRWEDDEISFKDLRKSRNLNSKGYQKVKNFASFVQSHNHGMIEYIWVDTCCIDKRSSAELSEAINSMYKWYKNAQVCYAYLNDVADGPEDFVLQALIKSDWFTRGWTLQELLAPGLVHFVDKSWKVILGDKRNLCYVISEITGIKSWVLEQTGTTTRRPALNSCSVAQKMSWAARRTCTREEDSAYCLMGLFEVQMPALYGEGGRSAFQRLQQEILKKSMDESIFAWRGQCDEPEWTGMLARSPKDFENSGSIIECAFDLNRVEYVMTNRGLKFEAVLGRELAAVPEATLFALNCADDRHSPTPIFVWLWRNPDFGNVFTRHTVLNVKEREFLKETFAARLDSSSFTIFGGQREVFFVR